MATSLTLQNDASLAQGYVKVNGTTSATFTTSGITGNLVGNVTGSLTQGGSLTLATAQTASGTSVDFTSIPSWAKRITVMFNAVSTNGSSGGLVQIGSGSFTTSGYVSASISAAMTNTVSSSSSTSGFYMQTGGASENYIGYMVLNNISGNTWISSHSLNRSLWSVTGGGSIALGGTLDRVRITTVNGTDTFDAGTINISFEG